jgi:hypothetical protein
MTKVTEVLSKHVWCILINASIIIAAVLIYGILTEAGASEIFGTISSVVSIVLGVVVIIYTFYQNYLATQSIERVKDLVSEAPKIIAERTAALHETASRMTGIADSLSKMMPKLFAQDTITSKTSGSDTTEDTFDMQLNFAKGPHVAQGFLYAVVKGYEKEKPLPMLEIGEAVYGKAENEGIKYLMNISVLGMLIIIARCFKDINFDSNSDEATATATATVHKLPEGFVDYIERNARKILEGEEGKAKKTLQAIDTMFA